MSSESTKLSHSLDDKNDSGDDRSKTKDEKPIVKSDPVFKPLNPDEDDADPIEIESYCVNCGKNGLTRMLLTKIPHYKDIVVMSFSCPHCGNENNEIQSAEPIGAKGIRYSLTVTSPEDLNRQVVKSDNTSIKIPILDFEISSQSQKAEITTVEGVINRAISGLEQDQYVRRIEHPKVAVQIDEFIKKLKKLKTLEEPFQMIFDDITGNMFVENPKMPHPDPNCVVSMYVRSKESDEKLGISHIPDEKGGVFKYEDLEGEVLHFATNCPNCTAPCETNMKVTNIPYFKEVVIMSTNCEACGNRTNEVKSGTGIEPKGLLLELSVKDPDDLSRDILKSDTCIIKIPELDLEVGAHSLGGRFTTVEGLVSSMRDQLSEKNSVFSDSSDPKTLQALDDFLKKMDEFIKVRQPFTLILDDPAGNSYVQSLLAPEPDPSLKVTHYERTFEQNEDLGLNDIKTENYET